MIKEDISKIVYEIVVKYEKLFDKKDMGYRDYWKEEIVDEVVKYIKHRDCIVKNFPKCLNNNGIQNINLDGIKGMNRGI